eukprot:2398132-Amphidinium_carterae.2
MKERDLDGARPNYAAEAAPGKLLNRVTVVGTNLGGPRRRADLRNFLCQCACHVHACLELVTEADKTISSRRGLLQSATTTALSCGAPPHSRWQDMTS